MEGTFLMQKGNLLRINNMKHEEKRLSTAITADISNMEQDEKKVRAICMLKEKHETLGRNPVRSDFKPEEVSFIKAKLGPWPRALEAAGLKEPAKTLDAAEKSRQKRAKAKKRMRRLKNEQGASEAKTSGET